MPSKQNTLNLAEVTEARALFQAVEPRDVFYRVATELIDLALSGKTTLTVADALAVLLQTWNKNYYRFHAKFDAAHLDAIEALLKAHADVLAKFRSRQIVDMDVNDVEAILIAFERFESVLGPVGTAKALHLLAPDFFPIWDRKIAAGCGVPLNGKRPKGKRYLKFMHQVREQCEDLHRQDVTGNSLKAIDEYNYCRHTLPGLKRGRDAPQV